jgi:hypothetical protein
MQPRLAPKPGSRAADEAARQFLRITVKGNTYDLMPALEMNERFVVRLATGGLPFEAFMPRETAREIGEDSLFILWWVARRQNGEPALPFKQAQAEWSTLVLNEEGDFDFAIVDLDAEPVEDDSPEGPGPAS